MVLGSRNTLSGERRFCKKTGKVMGSKEKESTIGSYLNATPEILDYRSNLSQCLLLFPLFLNVFHLFLMKVVGAQMSRHLCGGQRTTF